MNTLQLEEILKNLKSNENKKKIGFTCSCFDILHAGHYLMLEDAKKQCDVLIVGLQTDPTIDVEYRVTTNGKNKNIPIQSYQERYIQLNGCKYVNYIVKYESEDDLYKLLKIINPDVRILGSDWYGKKYTGHDLEIKIHWHKREHSYSTSNLRKLIYNAELEKNKILNK